MRILIIKLTSMGDLMHALPSITDVVQHYPEVKIDWVVDESFAEVPLWHPAVNRVIKTAHRRWKKYFSKAINDGELKDFYRQLNADDYDVVVDLQSNLKSAFVSWLRKGVVHGYDGNSCREKPAHWAYKKRFKVALRQHAIERQRQLMSMVLNYPKPETRADYGTDFSRYQVESTTLPEDYVLFVHNASWPTKLWPLEHWQSLLTKVAATGYSILLPSGSDREFQRAQAIAADHPAVITLPKLSLNETAAIVDGAKAAVCSDTGLAHLAAVAGTPAITLYAVTDTVLIGTYGENQQHILADGVEGQRTMNTISVDQVWQSLKPLLDKS